jgi:hypothetical protein
MKARFFPRLLAVILPVIGHYLLTLVITSLATMALFALQVLTPSIVALLYLVPVSLGTVQGPSQASRCFFSVIQLFLHPAYYTLITRPRTAGSADLLAVAVGVSQMVARRAGLAE